MRPKLPHSERDARIVLTFIALVSVLSIVVLSFAPPHRGGWWGVSLLDVNGILSSELVLIAVWSALGTAPWFVRWASAGAAFWLAVRPLQFGSSDLELWKLYLGSEIVPDALLTFTILYFLRVFGMRVCRVHGDPKFSAPPRQYGLTKLFAWVVGAAVISLAWKFLLDRTHGVAWPRTFGIRQILIEGVSRNLSLALIDLVAIWSTLGCAPLRWRQTWLIFAVLLVQTVIWRLADGLVLGRTQSWLNDLLFVCGYDAFYLAPLVTALLVTRSTGNRLTRASGASDKSLLPSRDG